MPLMPFRRDTIESLIAGSEGSQLITYQFANKQLEFQLFHAGKQALVTFTVPTDTVHGRTVQDNSARSLCQLDLIPLRTRLEVRHDRYMPPTDARAVLADARDRICLAYGRRAEEYGWLLALNGQYPILCCLVGSPSEIVWAVD